MISSKKNTKENQKRILLGIFPEISKVVSTEIEMVIQQMSYEVWLDLRKTSNFWAVTEKRSTSLEQVWNVDDDLK